MYKSDEICTTFIKHTVGHAGEGRQGGQGRPHQLLEAGQAWEWRPTSCQERGGQQGPRRGEGRGVLVIIVVVVYVEFTLTLALLLEVAGRFMGIIDIINSLKFIVTDIFSIMIYVIT